MPVHTAWDIGHRHSTANWFFQVVGPKVRIIDFCENHGQYADHYCGVVSARGYRQGNDYVPHDARVHECGTGKTRLETLIALGRKPQLVPEHKVEDGINAAPHDVPSRLVRRRRLLLGALAILAGAVLLSWEGHGVLLNSGALLVAGACLAWGIDNNLTRKLSSADPVRDGWQGEAAGDCDGWWGAPLTWGLAFFGARTAAEIASRTWGAIAALAHPSATSLSACYASSQTAPAPTPRP